MTTTTELTMTRPTELVRQAVEETQEQMQKYVNQLEGYGDMCRQLLGVLEEAKELKKQCQGVVDYIDGNEQGLVGKLNSAEIQAMRLTLTAMGMCAKLRCMRGIVLPEGSLLDMVVDDDDD